MWFTHNIKGSILRQVFTNHSLVRIAQVIDFNPQYPYMLVWEKWLDLKSRLKNGLRMLALMHICFKHREIKS